MIDFQLFLIPTLETIYMVFLSTIFAGLIGLPCGVLLVVSEENHVAPNPTLHRFLGLIVNISRSIPFIILMILLFPLSRLIVGTTIGTTATVIPLAISAAPFVARVVESSLKEVNAGVIEACRSQGASTMQMITKVLLPEALPSLVLGITMTIINLIGYSAMAGAIGGGGLGDLAIRFGFYRYELGVLIIAVIIIIVLVQLMQYAGNALADAIYKKRS
jgi:D-methionine transport system permease protein